LVASTRADGEPAGLISVDLTGIFNGLSVHKVGVGFRLGWATSCSSGSNGRFCFGGPGVLALLLQVAFDGGLRLGEMLLDEVGCESWPGGEIAGVDGGK
jgi:hypothetical protein